MSWKLFLGVMFAMFGSSFLAVAFISQSVICLVLGIFGLWTGGVIVGNYFK